MIENPILLWALVGGASGAILGLAGTGGGVAAIPLLMIFGGYDVKAASAYGLLSLTVGALLNWGLRYKDTVYLVVLPLILSAAGIAQVTVPFKLSAPPWVIVLLLNITCLFNLYHLWRGHPSHKGEGPSSLWHTIITAIFGGIITGFLTTMTGLGGGAFIIPWLTGITRLSFQQALACSLLIVGVIAPFSAGRQIDINLPLEAWGSLLLGICLTSLLVRYVMGFFSPPYRLALHKLGLTGIILFSMWKTLICLL